MKYQVALLALLASTNMVRAEPSTDEKACILKAASMLPTIAGLVINNSAAPHLDKDLAIKAIESGFGDALNELHAITTAFPSALDDRTQQAVQSDIASGRDLHARETLRQSLEKEIQAASSVALAVHAAAQDVTYAFMCARNGNGKAIVLPLGISP